MSSDAGSRQPPSLRPDFTLPEVLDVQARRIPYDPPRHRHFRSTLAQYNEATEITVRTAEPIPIRALGPALYVDDTPVTECAALEPTVYRFLAFDPEALRPGAPISLGWTGQPAGERQPTRFVFRESKG